MALVNSAAETTNRTTHTTPGGNVATAGSYVVSYWADKNGSTATTPWTVPAGAMHFTPTRLPRSMRDVVG